MRLRRDVHVCLSTTSICKHALTMYAPARMPSSPIFKANRPRCWSKSYSACERKQHRLCVVTSVVHAQRHVCEMGSMTGALWRQTRGWPGQSRGRGPSLLSRVSGRIAGPACDKGMSHYFWCLLAKAEERCYLMLCSDELRTISIMRPVMTIWPRRAVAGLAFLAMNNRMVSTTPRTRVREPPLSVWQRRTHGEAPSLQDLCIGFCETEPEDWRAVCR